MKKVEALMHNNGYVIIHILVDVTQEQSSDDAHASKCNTDQIHPMIGLGESDLACPNDDGVRGCVAGDSRDEGEFGFERCAGQEDGFFDVGGVGDAKFEGHGAANVFGD